MIKYTLPNRHLQSARHLSDSDSFNMRLMIAKLHGNIFS